MSSGDQIQPQQPGAPAPVARACRQCHAPLEAQQDWCLSCGAAANDRKHRLPGRQMVIGAAASTLLLTGGAVAAAYAALSTPASAPRQLAQTVPAPGTPDTVPAPSTVPTAPTTPTLPKIPKLKTPKLPKVTGPSDLPSLPSSPLPNPTPAPTPTPSTTPTLPPPTPKPAPKPVALKFAPEDVGPYDPDSRIVSPPSNRAKLFDNDETTAWTAQALEGEATLGFGITVDLKQAERLKSLTLSGKTGGVEIYGTGAEDLPQSVADPAWTKLGGFESLDGQKTVDFNTKSKKRYDLVLVWFTTAPPAGPTVSLSSLSITALR